MALILGIDTGCTYTDSVLFDASNNKVLSASKAFTTHSDLSAGISESIAKLYFKDLKRISAVHLSSTLSTNGLLENVGLISAVSELLNSIKEVLHSLDIQAPLFVMRSDGSLISEERARNNPIETILSGPAASVGGSLFLTGLKDYILLDMGGTSTDITRIENGSVRMAPAGIHAGKYNIPIRALDIQTFGIGGNSNVFLDQLGNIMIGPKNVMPLCVLGEVYPHLIKELKKYKKPKNYELLTAQETDCYIGIKTKYGFANLSDLESKIVKLLHEQPHSLFYLANYFEADADALHMNHLVQRGFVQCASLTPTDILHAANKFTAWNRDIALAGVEILANRLKKSILEFIEEINEIIMKTMIFSCMQSIANFEEKGFHFSNSPATAYMINKFLDDKQLYLGADFSLKKPIVAVGAPAPAWVKNVAEKLQTDLIIPEHYEVAAAIGAAVCTLKEMA